MPDHEENETCNLDVFWTFGDGRQLGVSLSRVEAEQQLQDLAESFEEVREWSVQQTRETVPLANGLLCAGFGEAISLDDNGEEASRRSYQPIHVFWKCPRCGESHNGNIYKDPVNRSFPIGNPSLWFCECGEGIVLVKWPVSTNS